MLLRILNCLISFLKTNVAPTLTLFALACIQCTKTESLPIIDVYEVQLAENKIPVTIPQMLSALEQVAPPDSEKGLLLKDVHLMLQAQDFNDKNMPVEALHAWRDALRIAEGAFGEKAFLGWVGMVVSRRPDKITALELAKVVLQDTKAGEEAPFLSQEKLLDPESLARYLAKRFSLQLKPTQQETKAASKEFSYWFESADQDPLFELRAREYCQFTSQQKTAFNERRLAPPSKIKEYWAALTLECSGLLPEAANKFTQTTTSLYAQKETHIFALNALTHATSIYRRLGLREDAAKAYLKLLEIWTSSAIGASNFKETDMNFFLRKINDALWAARYQSLVGDNDKADEIARNAYDKLVGPEGLALTKKATTSERQAMTDYTTETFHIRSAHVAFERKAYKEAISLNLMALQLPDVSPTWKERLTWNLGMFSYVDQDYAAAQKYWYSILGALKDDAAKPRVYYWLAKAAAQLKQDDEQQKYTQALLNEFPLSYYTVVAAQTSNLLGKQWQLNFLKDGPLSQRLGNNPEADAINTFRQNNSTSQLLLRAELLIKAKLQTWAKIALTSLDRHVRRNYEMHKKNLPLYIYLSRLQFANGNYIAGVSLTQELSKITPDFWENYPEQILIFFPVPHLDIFNKYAKDNLLESALLFGVARQESTFRHDIKSPAGAIGMMQVMPHTAAKLARQLNVKFVNIERDLIDVDFNVHLASYYLKELNNNFVNFAPAVFGAYNAGEYPVKQWLKNRYARDPILWIELIPFAETKEYVKNVWRNHLVYEFLNGNSGNSLAFAL